MSAVALSDVVVSLQEVADVYRITCCVPPKDEVDKWVRHEVSKIANPHMKN